MIDTDALFAAARARIHAMIDARLAYVPRSDKWIRRSVGQRWRKDRKWTDAKQR